MKISIIVPVYNVEKYIEKCLLSIAKQSYQDFEIIVVDDGSTDRSGEICDQLEKIYNNIMVIHSQNGGVSNARNIGLSRACGEYVWFVDSDDFVSPDAVETIVRHVEMHSTLDLLIFDAITVDEEGKQIQKIQCDLPCGKAMDLNSQRSLVFANTSLWNRIYRMDIIRNKQLTFETNITIAEDLLFNYKYLLECHNIYYEKDALYFYLQRKQSAMSGGGKNRDVQKVFEHLILYYKNKDVFSAYKREIEYLAIYHYYLVTSIRMLRCGIGREECMKISKWFSEQGIKVTFSNPYVRKMAPKHIFLIVLLKLKWYKMISVLFAKF